MKLCAYIDNALFEEFMKKQEFEGIPYDTYKTRNNFLKEVGTPRIVWEKDYIASESHFQYKFHYYIIPQGIYIKYNTSWPGYKFSCMKMRYIKNDDSF
jgi:hypothetical protein